MSNRVLNVNTDAVVGFSNTLDKMHKSAFPSAIRGALNKAVFDVKTKTMPKVAKSRFEKRQPNFFKANSRFKNAKGFNIKSMKATVGFVENRLKGSNNFAVKDLEQQEHGGEIKSRSFIPTALARTSKSSLKKVRANARFGKIRNIVDQRRVAGRSRQQKFVVAAKKAGVGGYVLGDLGNKMILWQVNLISPSGTGFKLKALYSFKDGRSVRVRKTNFMKHASLRSAKKIEAFYIVEAKRQIKKFENK